MQIHAHPIVLEAPQTVTSKGLNHPTVIRFQLVWALPETYQGVPVSVDAVREASDEENEVGGRDEERGEGDKHHPALQQRHRHVGGCHQYPYQTTEYL